MLGVRSARPSHMPAYVVSRLTIHDRGVFEQYLAAAPRTVDRFGARYLFRGGKPLVGPTRAKSWSSAEERAIWPSLAMKRFEDLSCEPPSCPPERVASESSRAPNVEDRGKHQSEDFLHRARPA
jgi:Domain of unknown function (DUF1330)